MLHFDIPKTIQNMPQLNRRAWLQRAGLASALFATGRFAYAAPTQRFEVPAFLLENGVVRLTSNENPYGPSENIKLAMQKAMQDGFRYPYQFYQPLIQKIAEKEGVPANCILLTSGSNEGLRVAGLTYGLHGGEILTAMPTYDALMTYAEEIGAYINAVPLDETMSFDLEEIEKRINTNTRLVFLCNPNNPSGTLLNPQRVKDFCETASDRTMVFSDEAYYDYIAEPNYPSMVYLVKEGKNVIISKTFSKVYGMAGVRVGYLIARPDIIERMSPKVMGYVNVMGIFGAMAALEDKTFYQFSLKKNAEAREHIYQVCKDLKLEYVPSHANFVFIKTGRPIQSVQQDMQKQGVLVGRPFPPMMNWCRVSTSTMEDMKVWESAMRKVFA